MAIIDNTLAQQVPQFNAATPLMEAGKIQAQQQELQAAQLKEKQSAVGAEMRGMVPFVNTEEFPARWAQAADRMLQRGVIDPQTHQQIVNSPSPLMMKSIIAKTEDPTLSFRKDEAARDQKNTDRSFGQTKLNADRTYGLAVRAADRADEDKPVFKEVTDPNTQATSIVAINPKTLKATPIDSGITPSTPNNPFVTGPKLNTDQSKSATMVDRMNDANKVITKNEGINDDPFGYLGGMAAAIPKVRDSAIFNTFASPERQQAIQAQRNFVNAILRVESGAAISQSEFDNAQRQYFPQPGDSKAVIDQKRQNRVTAMQGMAREAGPNYKPPNDILPTKPGKPNVTSSGVKWSVE